jgi:GT2 family glycosyltransferase
VRPTASVIVPFAGSQRELDELVARLRGLEVREGDQVLVADNRAAPAPPADPGPVRWITAGAVAAPSFARNAAAREARGEWLVFLDGDVEPDHGLVDAYLDPAPPDGVGILGGALEDVPGGPGLAARYAVSRGMMSQATTLRHPHAPFVQTANCAVRRTAFEAVGGLAEDARAGEDADLCWRLAAAGWRLELRDRARARHRSRPTLRALLSQLAVHGAGSAWLDRRHPGSDPPPRLRSLLGRLRYYPLRAWREWRAGRHEEAAFVLVDLLALYAYDAGRLRSNAPRRPGRRRPGAPA